MKIVQIVPRLPPPPEGVGSYAEALAGALAELQGIDTRFLVGTPSEAIEDDAPVLLHYVGYGYQRRGCPRELVARLAAWRRGGEGRRLATFFHEVYATGPPWRSSFWLSGVQRKLARTLAQASDGLATSLDLYAGLLTPWVDQRVFELPVFSTVGEPGELPPLAARRRRLVVFGGPGARGRAFGEALADLVAACARLGIEEVAEVGPPLPALPALPAITVPRTVAGAPVRSLGTLPASRVSALLADSLAGFLAYPPRYLAKSTIFAAYCAHRVVPLCAWRRRRGAEATVPVVLLDGSPLPSPGEMAATAPRAHAWYRTHSLGRQAEAFRNLLFPACGS